MISKIIVLIVLLCMPCVAYAQESSDDKPITLNEWYDYSSGIYVSTRTYWQIFDKNYNEIGEVLSEQSYNKNYNKVVFVADFGGLLSQHGYTCMRNPIRLNDSKTITVFFSCFNAERKEYTLYKAWITKSKDLLSHTSNVTHTHSKLCFKLKDGSACLTFDIMIFNKIVGFGNDNFTLIKIK